MLLAACTSSGPPREATLPNVPVPAVDLQRYAGLWYEQAHLPLWFQRRCVADTTARYATGPDDMIQVVNRCRTGEGTVLQARGEARRMDGSTARLEVRFAPSWLSWLPMVWGDYWVIGLDADYRWAMVGTPDRRYLWILSRRPRLDPETMAMLVARARAMGYPVDALIATPQGAPVD